MLFVVFVVFVVGFFVCLDKLMSFVIFLYWTNFHIFGHHIFALVWSCFPNVGMVSFCVLVRSAVLLIVSLVSSCLRECDSAPTSMCFLHFFEYFVCFLPFVSSIFVHMCSDVTSTITLTATCCIVLYFLSND